MTEENNLCDNCKVKGECCHLHLMNRSTKKVYTFLNVSCRYYDAENKSCSIYDNRLTDGCCIDILKAIECALLPNECEYVKNINGYAGPVVIRNEDNKNNEMLLEIILSGTVYDRKTND
jgi:uncharacterized cysteine cluster protein YcgN (CxxCxxCC family)